MQFLLVAVLFMVPTVGLAQTSAPSETANAQKPQIVAWQKEMTLVISGNKAVYPQIAQIAHVEGCVYVSFGVSTDGSTQTVGPLAGPALMRQSAVEAVRSWKFKSSEQEVTTIAPLCYFLKGDNPQKLLESYEKAVQKSPNNAKKVLALADELLLVGMPDEAETQFRKVLTLKIGLAEANFGLGDSLAAQGRMADAAAEYQQGLLTDAKDTRARMRFAELLRSSGDLDGAIAQYHSLLQTDAKNAFYHSNLANLLLEKGDADGAIDENKKALHDDANVPFFHYQLGQAYEKKGNTTDALKEYSTAMKAMPANSEFRAAYDRLSSQTNK